MYNLKHTGQICSPSAMMYIFIHYNESAGYIVMLAVVFLLHICYCTLAILYIFHCSIFSLTLAAQRRTEERCTQMSFICVLQICEPLPVYVGSLTTLTYPDEVKEGAEGWWDWYLCYLL